MWGQQLGQVLRTLRLYVPRNPSTAPSIQPSGSTPFLATCPRVASEVLACGCWAAAAPAGPPRHTAASTTWLSDPDASPRGSCWTRLGLQPARGAHCPAGPCAQPRQRPSGKEAPLPALRSLSAGTWPSEPRFPASLEPWEHPAAGPRAWERVGTGSTSAGGVAAWVTVRTAVSRGPLPPRQAIQPLVWEHSHLNLLKLCF